MSMKTNRWFALTALLAPLVASAASHSSANYSVPADTVDGGGRRVTSAAYSNDGSIGGLGGLSTVASPAQIVKHGYPAQLIDVSGIAVSANPTNISENGTRQLNARLAYDDDTVSPVAAASVAWSVLSGPLSSVNASGLATATNVYQDTPATVGAGYGGYNSTLGLLVINTGIDDFAFYAADGINDAWQVQYFGENNPNAFPGIDADGDGQTNYFEYVATTIPTDADSKFRFSINAVPGRPTFRDLRFSPVSVLRDYAVESRPTVDAGAFNPLTGLISDAGIERTVTDTNAAGAEKFYRVRIKFP